MSRFHREVPTSHRCSFSLISETHASRVLNKSQLPQPPRPLFAQLLRPNLPWQRHQGRGPALLGLQLLLSGEPWGPHQCLGYRARDTAQQGRAPGHSAGDAFGGGDGGGQCSEPGECKSESEAPPYMKVTLLALYCEPRAGWGTERGGSAPVTSGTIPRSP